MWRKELKNQKRREIKKAYTIDDRVSRNVNTNKPFLERILSYKEYIPLISILFTAALTIFKAFIIRGIKEYYGIPEIFEISTGSFLQNIIETVGFYFVVFSCVYVYYESHEYFLVNCRGKEKPKQFIKCLIFHFFGILLLLICIVIFASCITTSFGGIGKGFSGIEIGTSNNGYAILFLFTYIMFVAFLFSIGDIIKLSRGDSYYENKKTNNKNVYFKGAKHIYYAGMCFITLMVLLIFSLFSGLFVDIGNTIGKSVNSYAVVSCNDGKYAVLAKSGNEYICIKIMDEDEKRYSLEKKIFKIIDLEDKELRTIKCKFDDLFSEN